MNSDGSTAPGETMLTSKPSSVALLVLVLLSLNGCGSTAPAAGLATALPAPQTVILPATPATTNATRYQIALVLGKTTDPFYTSMKCGALAKAAELGDVDLVVEGGSDWNPKLQLPIIDRLVAKKVQAIAVVVNDGKALHQPLKAAHDAGIKVLGVDTQLEDTSFQVTNIGSDNYRLGVEAAITLAKLIGDKGTVVTRPPPKGVGTVGDRIQGFVDEITASHPDIKIVYTKELVAGTPVSEQTATYRATLVAHPDAAGIFTTASDQSEGAAEAVKTLPADRQAQINLVSFDAGPELVDALRANQIQVLVAQKPGEMGALAVEMARRSLRGERVEKIIPTGGVGLTKQNIDSPDFSKYLYKSSC
jgi:ribose transport system substrate-binding protein